MGHQTSRKFTPGTEHGLEAVKKTAHSRTSSVDGEEDGEEEDEREEGQRDEGACEEHERRRPAQNAGPLLVVPVKLHVALLHVVNGRQATEEDVVQAVAAPDHAVDAVVDTVVRVGQDADGRRGGEGHFHLSLSVGEQRGVMWVVESRAAPCLAPHLYKDVVTPGIHGQHVLSPLSTARLRSGEQLTFGSDVSAVLTRQTTGQARGHGARSVIEALCKTTTVRSVR